MVIGLPSTSAVVIAFPLVLATTRVLPDDEGVGFSRSISIQSLFPFISTVIAIIWIFSLYGMKLRFNHEWVLAPITGESEQHQKQVDEVKVQRQSAEDGRFSALNSLGCHFFDFPGIVCSQSGEDYYANA